MLSCISEFCRNKQWFLFPQHYLKTPCLHHVIHNEILSWIHYRTATHNTLVCKCKRYEMFPFKWRAHNFGVATKCNCNFHLLRGSELYHTVICNFPLQWPNYFHTARLLCTYLGIYFTHRLMDIWEVSILCCRHGCPYYHHHLIRH